MNTKVVVAGHVCIDIIPHVARSFDLLPGRLYEVGPAVIDTGGPVSNTGVALHILGIPTMLMGKLGDDSFGRAIIEVFNRYSPELSQGMVVVKGETTSYSVVINVPGKDRSFLHCPGANNSFAADDVQYDKVAQAGLFHFGYPPLMARTYESDGAQLVSIFKRVKELGVTTSLDLVMPDPSGPSGQANWQRILERTVPFVDVFLPSADELLYMIDRPHFGAGDNLTGEQVSALGERLLGLGAAIAGVKLGSRGLYLRTAGPERLAQMGRVKPRDPAAWANRELWFPVFHVDHFAGATGAGDSTIAGFLSALLRGLSFAEAGTAANMTGAMNVQAPSALGGLRPWDEMMRVMSGARKEPLTVTGQGWTADAATGIWRGPHERR